MFNQAPNPGGENYAFEDFGQMREAWRQKSLGDFFKRMFMTPSQAAAQEAANVPQMGVDQDFDPATHAAILQQLQAPTASLAQDFPTAPMPPVGPEEPPMDVSMGDFFSNPEPSTPAERPATASARAPRPQASRPPMPPQAQAPADPRPMTSRGPAMGPFPQGVPHNIGDGSAAQANKGRGGSEAAFRAPGSQSTVANANKGRGGEGATIRAPRPGIQTPQQEKPLAASSPFSSFMDFFNYLLGSGQPSSERQLFEQNFRQSGMGDYGNKR